MLATKLIRDRLWATLVGALLAAIVVCFFVFVQSGEATPQEAATDEQPPYASVTPRIVGGTAVPNGKYPFMAYIELYGNGKGIGACTGSLIDRDSVLTAAHCFDPPVPTKASLTVGVTDLRQLNQDQIRRVVFKDSYLHRRYNPQKLFVRCRSSEARSCGNGHPADQGCHRKPKQSGDAGTQADSRQLGCDARRR